MLCRPCDSLYGFDRRFPGSESVMGVILCDVLFNFNFENLFKKFLRIQIGLYFLSAGLPLEIRATLAFFQGLENVCCLAVLFSTLRISSGITAAAILTVSAVITSGSGALLGLTFFAAAASSSRV